MINTIQENELDLIPVSKWNTVYKYPTVGAIRQMIFKDKERNTGFIKCIRNIGTRRYIKISAFKKWIEETNE